MSQNKSTQTIESAGHSTVQLPLGNGAHALVLPGGGRILGLYPAGSDENFLWTNAAPDYSGKAWPNPGGDRTWLAPEIELFIGDLKRPWETYAVQPALDPGHWTLDSATDAELCLTNSTRLRLYRSEREIDVRLRKSYQAAANPLSTSGLQYAGYTQLTTLELEPGANVSLGIWNLLQFPQPGTMLIPTRTAAGPQLVFGECAAGEITSAPGLVRWNMAAPGPDAKIAIKAEASTGRVGYLRETATPGVWDLIVREFAVDPAGNYVDALWESPHETGWAFQACCVRNGAALFNELEYHAPANRRQDESRVWAFRGSFDAIHAAAASLLERKLTNR
jgi:hypothetical protein